MFPDNLYISDPTGGRLYIVENDVVSSSMSIVNEARAILVCQNMADIYTVNRDNSTVTRIHNGEAMGDIFVGKMPYGICEDRNGRIYVTNYADYTVTVIEDGQVSGLPIPVSAGPRGIVADYYGNIWVACYLSNTVVKIVNRTVVDEISMPFNPEGITCSANNDIWVACSGSNVAVKITNSKKGVTISTGKCPVAIVCDRKGNIFTANFEDDSVTMITSDNFTYDIPVGDGPSAIAVNSENLIYVTSSLSGEKVYKINPASQQVIGKIQVCKSQCAFGDFTGCAAFNVFNPNGKSSDIIDSASVTNVVQSLKPRFSITNIEEDGDNYTFEVASDVLDLNKFDHISLNGVAMDDGSFTLSEEEIGDELQLIGYFNENDVKPIPFTPISASSFFKVYFSLVDSNYNNYRQLKEKNIDFTQKDLVTTFIQQPTAGHLLLLIPTRVFDAVKDGLMIQGSYNIGDAWKVTVPDSTTTTTETILSEQYTFDPESNNAAELERIIEAPITSTFTVTTGGSEMVLNEGYTLTNVDDTHTKITILSWDALSDNTIDVYVTSTVTTTVTGNSILSKIFEQTGWTEAKKAKYTILVNNYQTDAAEKWMFNFFSTLD